MNAGASTSAAGALRFDGSELTYNETVDALCSFMTVAIHSILCFRGVYPASVFTRKQSYSVPVWASRHPGLNEYIDDVVKAARVQIIKRNVKACHVVLSSLSTQNILERYRFDLDYLVPPVAARDCDLAIPGNMTQQGIDLHLRAFMQKLLALDGALEELDEPDDLTWAFVLVPRDGRAPETDDKTGNKPPEGPWVPFDDGPLLPPSPRSSPTSSALAGSFPSASSGASQTHGSLPNAVPRGRDAGSHIGADDPPSILPVKSLDTGVINLMLYVEEHPAAKRHSCAVFSQALPADARRLDARSAALPSLTQAGVSQLPDEVRDLDAPPVQPARGAAARRKKRGGGGDGAAAAGEEPLADEEQRSSSDGGESDASETSMRSVGSFEGYGGGGGMAGTRM